MVHGLPPVRCVSCGKPISKMVRVYWNGLEEGLSIAEAQRATGVHPERLCCVRTIRGAVPPWCEVPDDPRTYKISNHYHYLEATQQVRRVQAE